MVNAGTAVTGTHYRVDHGARSDAAPPDSKHDERPVACIDAGQFAKIITDIRRKPTADPKELFPWLHGISPQNTLATQFLESRYTGRDTRKLFLPPEEFEGVILVKSGDPENLNGKFRGSVTAHEVLATSPATDELIGQFLSSDPRNGVQLRNFEIQPSKFAQICDIVVYTSHSCDTDCAEREWCVKNGLAEVELIKQAQAACGLHRKTYFYPGSLESVVGELGPELAKLCLLEAPVDDSIEAMHRDLVHGDGLNTADWELGLGRYEQAGIIRMTSSTDIFPWVWLGNSLDIAEMRMLEQFQNFARENPALAEASHASDWKTVVICLEDSESKLPTLQSLDNMIRKVQNGVGVDLCVTLKLPSLGNLFQRGMTTRLIAGLCSICKFIFVRSQWHGVIIASIDGYHLSSPLAVLYVMYTTGKNVKDALLYLHKTCERPLSLGETEFTLLLGLERFILAFSPAVTGELRGLGAISDSAVKKFIKSTSSTASNEGSTVIPAEGWLARFSGTFPSRILPHLYLGSLEHANNPDMLRALGIKRIICVGETVDWLTYPIDNEQVRELGFSEILHISDFQDDGVDGLLEHLPPCLEILEESERAGDISLVHCRKGVSRSAAVCIAEVMRSRKWNLPQAYTHVRVHRLDVIIQPNLRIMYDLLKYEEGLPFLHGRTIEWPILSREITMLNNDYLL